MPLPQPVVPLTDPCSVIFNSTLYTYTSDAFQALPLTAGAKWATLPQGESVDGGVCVGSTPGDPATAAFFVVGGKSSKADYQGLQKFTYSTKKWESIIPSVSVTRDRLRHGAVYINSTDSILVYSGSVDGSTDASTHTFTIGASAPNTALAYTSTAPPANNPILLPWSATEAVLIGGNSQNTKIMLFSSTTGWLDSGASLAEPIAKDTSEVRAMLLTGDDGSKNLYTFDMTQSPNAVNRVILFSGTGVPVQNALAINRREVEEDMENERRDTDVLTINDWPEYNSTLAPTATRKNFAMAQDSAGLAVFAGGSTDDVLCIFDARENSWQNATERLTRLSLLAVESSSSSSLSSATTTTSSTSKSSVTFSTVPSSLPTAAIAGTESPTVTAEPAASSATSSTSTNTILGAVLGSILGVGLILFGIYWCIQRQRKRQAHMETGHARRASGMSSNEKSGVGYASNSLPPNLNAPGVFRGHQAQDSQASLSSLSFMIGRGKDKPAQLAPVRNPSRSTDHTRGSSGDSTFKAFKSTISKPIPQATQAQAQASRTAPGVRPPRPDRDDMQFREEKGVSFAPDTAEPGPRDPSAVAAIDQDGSMRRSSGWNRYWSGGSALNLFGNNNNNGNANSSSRRETVESDNSQYSSNQQNRITQDSATVPPLNLYEPRASFSRVNSRSPTIATYSDKIKEGMRGQIETQQRPVSAVSSASGYSSGIPASVHDAWDPTQPSRPWGADRVPSNAYTASVYTTYTTTTQLAPRPAQARPPVPRDDMSWLNLGDNNGH
ncbi:hypothetical protein B0T17DRAFT_495689 [Bombardia bombarda]|uniref:Pre-mRNA splicing factor CLF1 n=1 Tax=Bombardia bombarda TaxID=252184 RepID=A0AA40BYL0_9PEZI|nr:hypothetical protein B0T17DRAFT_495689 [Bombardia bombarda]